MNPRAKIIDICKLMVTELNTKKVTEGTLFNDISKIVEELTLVLDACSEDKLSKDQQQTLINLQTRLQTIHNKQPILSIAAPTLRHQLNECLVALEALTETPLIRARLSGSFFEVELEKMIPATPPQTADTPTPSWFSRLSKHK
jgi:hypothetical protein